MCSYKRGHIAAGCVCCSPLSRKCLLRYLFCWSMSLEPLGPNRIRAGLNVQLQYNQRYLHVPIAITLFAVTYVLSCIGQNDSLTPCTRSHRLRIVESLICLTAGPSQGMIRTTICVWSGVLCFNRPTACFCSPTVSRLLERWRTCCHMYLNADCRPCM